MLFCVVPSCCLRLEIKAEGPDQEVIPVAELIKLADSEAASAVAAAAAGSGAAKREKQPPTDKLLLQEAPAAASKQQCEGEAAMSPDKLPVSRRVNL